MPDPSGFTPYPPPHWQQPVRPGPASLPGVRQPRSLGASVAWLAGFSLISPVLVVVAGVLFFALKWLVAVGLVFVTVGMIMDDPRTEGWVTDLLTWEGFGAWMGGLMPWAAASLGVTLVAGGLVLLGLRRTRAVTWHPALQGLLAGLAGILVVVVAALFFTI